LLSAKFPDAAGKPTEEGNTCIWLLFFETYFIGSMLLSRKSPCLKATVRPLVLNTQVLP
jgi:hypothetical protein